MKGALLRWTLCAALVLVAHGAAWFAVARSRPVVDSDAGAPVVMLELAPISAAPPPPPEPAQPQAQPEAEEAPPPPPPVAQAEPPPTPPPEPTPSPEPTPTQAAADPDPPPPAPTATPEVVSAPPPPPPQPQPQLSPSPEPATQVDLPPQPPAPPPAAPSVQAAAAAETTAAPSAAPGREEDQVSPAALQSWQRELIARIEQHKRFPGGLKGRSGVVRVAFSIDRDGRLIDVRLLDSSGSATLDKAALDLIRVSQPFPAPPAALQENELHFVAPIRYLRSSTP